MDYLSQIQDYCNLNNILINVTQLNLLSNYAQILKEKNVIINLISRKDTDNIIENHIFHSLLLTKYITENEFNKYNYNDSTCYHQNYNSFYGNSNYYYDTKPWWLIEFNYFNSNVGNSYSSGSYSAPAVSTSNTSMINAPQPAANNNRNDNSSSSAKAESSNNSNNSQNSNKRSERNSDGSRGK